MFAIAFNSFKSVLRPLKWRQLSFAFLCFLLSSIVSASEPSFSVPEGEQTYVYLKKIFGAIPGVLRCDDLSCGILVPSIFKTLNYGVMTLGIGILAYVLYMGTAVSASEGEFLGKRYSSFWLPLRSSVGIAVLVPMYSGYSFLQIALMKIILSGVGLANYMYKTIDDYGSQYSISLDRQVSDEGDLSKPEVFSPKQIDDFVKNTFLYFVASIKASQSSDYASYVAEKANTDDEVISLQRDLTAKKITLSVLTKPQGDGPKISKGNQISKLEINYSGSVSDSQVSSLFGSSSTEILAGGGFIGMIFEKAFTYCTTYPNISDAPLPNQELRSIADLIKGSSMSIISPVTTIPEERQEILLDKEYSWLKVPSRYYVWVETNKDFSAKDSKPRVTFSIKQNYLSNDAVIASNVHADTVNTVKALAYRLKSVSLTGNAQGSNPDASSDLKNYYPMYEKLDSDEDGGANAFLLGMMLDPLKSESTEANDPLITLSEKGRSLIKTYLDTLFIMLGVSLGIVALSGICSAYQPSWVGTSYSFIQILMTIAQFFALVLPVAIMLGFYLPLVPLMIFNLAVIAWFMQVIEAMVAAPIITLGLLAPSQEGVGKAAPSMMLVLNIVLRPTLILVGLVMGSKLFSIFALYFSEIMSSGALLFTDGSNFTYLIFGWVWVMMYSSAIVTVAQKCFSLIYVIPDRVLTWIGGQALDSRDITQDLQEVKGAAAKSEEAIKGVGQLASQGFSSLGARDKSRVADGKSITSVQAASAIKNAPQAPGAMKQKAKDFGDKVAQLARSVKNRFGGNGNG